MDTVATAGLRSVHKHFPLNNRKGQTLKTLINHQQLGECCENEGDREKGERRGGGGGRRRGRRRRER